MTKKILKKIIFQIYEKIEKLNDLQKKEFYLIKKTAEYATIREYYKYAQTSIHARSIIIKNRQEQIISLCEEVEELEKEYSALNHKKK